MKFAADSSAIVRLYDPQTNIDDVNDLRRFLEVDGKLLTISELARIEVLHVLLRRPDTDVAARFDRDLSEGSRS